MREAPLRTGDCGAPKKVACIGAWAGPAFTRPSWQRDYSLSPQPKFGGFLRALLPGAPSLPSYDVSR